MLHHNKRNDYGEHYFTTATIFSSGMVEGRIWRQVKSGCSGWVDREHRQHQKREQHLHSFSKHWLFFLDSKPKSVDWSLLSELQHGIWKEGLPGSFCTGTSKSAYFTTPNNDHLKFIKLVGETKLQKFLLPSTRNLCF